MEIEITTDVARVPDLDRDGDLGFAVFVGVQATSAADDAHWRAAAALGIEAIEIFAPWRFQNLSLALAAPDAVPVTVAILPDPAIANAAAIRQQLEALLVGRGQLANTTYALTATGDEEDNERFAVPRFLAGLATQPAPFNRAVYRAVLLTRASVPEGGHVASIAFSLGSVVVDHPTGNGDDASADGTIARRWNLGAAFGGANLYLRSRVNSPQAHAWVKPSMDHVSRYSRQLDSGHGRDPYNDVAPTAGPIYVSAEANDQLAEDCAGALLFMRTLSGNARPWRCLSEAVSHNVRCLAPSPLASTTVSGNGNSHTFQGIEIPYDGDSLFIGSRFVGESLAQASDRDALLPLTDSDSRWSYEPTLGFGFDVEAAVLLVGNSGVLPVGLQQRDDPTALRSHVEDGGTDFDPPHSAIEAQPYVRRAPMGPCLLDSALDTVAQLPPLPDKDPILLAGKVDMAIHELPNGYFASTIDREPTTSLLLLDQRAPSRTLVLRAPTTSHPVLDRWLAADEREAGTTFGARADYRVAMDRLRDIDLETLSSSQRSRLQFADPAAQALLIELHDVAAAPKRSHVLEMALTRPEQHADLPDDASLEEQTRNSWSAPIELDIRIGAALSLSAIGKTVVVEIPVDAFAQLRVYVGADRAQWSKRCVPGLQPGYAPTGASTARVWLSPRSLRIETASKQLPAAQDLLQAISLSDDDDQIVVQYAPPKVASAKNIRDIDVSRQHWRWDGREVETPPRLIRTGSPPQWQQEDWNRAPMDADSAQTSGVLWETSNFIERLGRSPESERCQVPAGATAVVLRRWTKSHANEDVLRAAFVASHRYGKLLGVPPLNIGSSEDRYRRLRVPARSVSSAVAQPTLGLMLPLFDNVGDSSVAGDVLVVLQETWYQRGLAEQLQVEVQPIVRDLCRVDATDTPNCAPGGSESVCEDIERVVRAEMGPDPVLSSDANIEDGDLPALQCSGPFGLTFDGEIRTRRQVGTTFTVSGGRAFDFARLRFRRALEPAAYADYRLARPVSPRTLSADELLAFAQDGQLVVDVSLSAPDITWMPLTLTLDAMQIAITWDGTRPAVTVDGSRVKALTRNASPARGYRLTLVRQFEKRDDGLPGVWSLRFEALHDSAFETILSYDFERAAGIANLTVGCTAIAGMEWTVIAAPRYSRWTEGRWIQFWPQRNRLTPDAAPLKLIGMPLRLARNAAGAWQLVDADGVAIRHELTPEPQAPIGPGSARLFHWLLVTRRVRSGAGAVPSELPKSILGVANATDFREVDGAEPLAADETDLIARVLLVQRSPNAPVTGNLWQRLFPQPDATGQARDAQLRIVGISPGVPP